MGRAVSMGRPHLLRPLTEDRTCWTVGGFSEGIKPKTRRSATRSSVGPVRVKRLAPGRSLSPDTFPEKRWSDGHRVNCRHGRPSG
jgi:hypothetical protein